MERCARGAAAFAGSLLMAQASASASPPAAQHGREHLTQSLHRAWLLDLHAAWGSLACQRLRCQRLRCQPTLTLPARPPLVPQQAALAGNFTFDELQAKSYLEVKGSTLANQCPILG